MAQLALALAAAMAVTLVGYHLGRGAYLDAVVSSRLPRPAASAIFDTLAVGVLDAARTVFVVGILVWVGALIAGPAGWAVAVRGALSGPSRAPARAPSGGGSTWARSARGWPATIARCRSRGSSSPPPCSSSGGTPGVAGVSLDPRAACWSTSRSSSS